MAEKGNDNGGPAFPSGDFVNMEPCDGMRLTNAAKTEAK